MTHTHTPSHAVAHILPSSRTPSAAPSRLLPQPAAQSPPGMCNPPSLRRGRNTQQAPFRFLHGATARPAASLRSAPFAKAGRRAKNPRARLAKSRPLGRAPPCTGTRSRSQSSPISKHLHTKRCRPGPGWGCIAPQSRNRPRHCKRLLLRLDSPANHNGNAARPSRTHSRPRPRQCAVEPQACRLTVIGGQLQPSLGRRRRLWVARS